MIEPNGTAISLPPNRQTRVPGFGSDQKTVVQSHKVGAPNDQAQDDKGFGTIGTSGVADNVPGHTQRLDDCLKQGQDAGSHQSSFGVGHYDNSFGTAEGSHPIKTYSGPASSSDGADVTQSGDQSVQGAERAGGGKIIPPASEESVVGSILPGFPRGIIE